MGIGLWKSIQLSLKKFPYKIILYTRYKNAVIPTTHRGIYVNEKQSYEGGKIESHAFYFRRGFLNYEKIPYMSIKYIEMIGETKTLQVLKVDKNTYYPLLPFQGRLTFEVPVPAMDEAGNQIYEIEKNEKGEEIKRPKYFMQQRVFLESTQVQTEEGFKEIPLLYPQEAISGEMWAQSEHIQASLIYASKNFWEKYGAYVLIIVMLLGTAITIKVTYDGFNQGVSLVSQQLASVAASNAQIAEALKPIVANMTKTG